MQMQCTTTPTEQAPAEAMREILARLSVAQVAEVLTVARAMAEGKPCRGLPAAALQRLATFAEATRTTPPAKLMEGTGADLTFSDELLTYCRETGLSLDWLLYGTTKQAAPQVEMAKDTAIRQEFDRWDVLLTQIEGLVRALQAVMFDFADVQLDKEASQKRQGIIAIADALEEAGNRIDPPAVAA